MGDGGDEDDTDMAGDGYLEESVFDDVAFGGVGGVIFRGWWEGEFAGDGAEEVGFGAADEEGGGVGVVGYDVGEEFGGGGR